MEHSFKKISIIGLGLIGGSIGLAVNRYDKNIRRIGVARSEETLEKAISRGLVDEATNKLNDAVDDTDLVILALTELFFCISLRHPIDSAHPVCHPVLVTMQWFFEFRTHSSASKCSVTQALLDPFNNDQILNVDPVPKFNQF